MVDTSPQDLVRRDLEAFIAAHGPTGLVEDLFYRDRAIALTLSDSRNPEYESLKNSLMEILTGENPVMHLQKQAVAASVDATPPRAEHGFLPIAVKAAAGMDQQIAAVGFLASLSAADDEVYQLLWKVARGDTSRITNVSNAAIKALSGKAFPARTVDLKQVALNPTRKNVDRILAYQVMAGAAMFTDPEVYGLVCNLASDQSIRRLYDRQGILSPPAGFWFDHELKMRRDFPNQYKDGKSRFEVRYDVIEKVQREFQETFFGVVSYALGATYSTDLWNNIGAMNGLREGFPQTSQRLTRELCRLVIERPSYHVQNLCTYAKTMKMISKQEARHIAETLEQVRSHLLGFDPNSVDWIDGTLNEVEYRLRKKQDGYLDRPHLESIWKGEMDPAQLVASWRG